VCGFLVGIAAWRRGEFSTVSSTRREVAVHDVDTALHTDASDVCLLVDDDVARAASTTARALARDVTSGRYTSRIAAR